MGVLCENMGHFGPLTKTVLTHPGLGIYYIHFQAWYLKTKNISKNSSQWEYCVKIWTILVH